MSHEHENRPFSWNEISYGRAQNTGLLYSKYTELEADNKLC